MTSSVMPSGTEEEEEGPATTAMQGGQTCDKEKCVRKCLYVNERREREEVDIGAGVGSVGRCVVKSKQTQEKETIKSVRNKTLKSPSAQKTCRGRQPSKTPRFYRKTVRKQSAELTFRSINTKYSSQGKKRRFILK